MKTKNISSGFSQYNTCDVSAVRIELKSGEVYDITNSFVELEVYRSLFSMMSGCLIFADVMNITNNGPITGGEKVWVRYKSPIYDDYTELVFRVSMIAERVSTSQASSLVKYELVSEAYYFGVSKQICTSLEGTYTNIAKKFWNLTGIDVKLFADESQGLFKFVVPYSYSALEAMNMFASRAVGTDELPFMFYEDIDGVNFVSVSNMIAQTNSTRLIHQPQLTEENFQKQWSNIIAIQNEENTRDALEFMKEGLGGLNEEVFSISEKKITQSKRSFESDYIFKLNAGNIPVSDSTFCSQNRVIVKESNNKNVFVKKSLNWAIQFNKLTICNHGDNQARLGQIIELDLNATQLSQDGKIPKERFFSGKYIVTSIKDTIRPNEYRTYRGLNQESLKIGAL